MTTLDLIRMLKTKCVSLPVDDPHMKTLRRFERLGLAECNQHNQWTAKAKPATVAQVGKEVPRVKSAYELAQKDFEIAKANEPELTVFQYWKRTIIPTTRVIGQCRVKRGDLLMVRVYDVVREWKPDHYLIKDPVVGGTFSRHISEIEMQNMSYQAVA